MKSIKYNFGAVKSMSFLEETQVMHLPFGGVVGMIFLIMLPHIVTYLEINAINYDLLNAASLMIPALLFTRHKIKGEHARHSIPTCFSGGFGIAITLILYVYQLGLLPTFLELLQ